MSARKTPVNGVVLYRGPSAFNGLPIVVVATGLHARSENIKTGEMVQTYILADDAQFSPVEHVQRGSDASICGDCVHRGQDGKIGSCYVNQCQGPGQVARALANGNYPRFNAIRHRPLFKGRNVRFGSYGDPAACPIAIWENLAKITARHTGYTHAWRKIDPAYAGYCMASVETEQQRDQAKSLGYRTFRVRLASQPLVKNEIACPASEEGGKRRTCDTCKACSGATSSDRAADVAIIFHGSPIGGNWKLKLFEKTMAKLLSAEQEQQPTRRVALPMS